MLDQIKPGLLSAALALILSLVPQQAFTQDGRTTAANRQLPQITFTSDDIARRYVAPDHQAFELPRDMNTLESRGLLERAIAYNIKYWHLVRGAGVICNSEVHDIGGIRLEAVHFYEQGTRATAYYTALTRASTAPDAASCSEARAELVLVRLIDNELFAPEWGHRLVRPR